MSVIEFAYFTWVFAGLPIGVKGISASPLVEWTRQTESTMDSITQRVIESFAGMEKGRDPTLVHEALDMIEAAEREIPLGDAAARKRALSRRFFFCCTGSEC